MNGLAQYHSTFPRNARPGQKTLDRSSLPDPLNYILERGLSTGRPRGEWATIRCPVHDDDHPSMNVSITDGHFRCHACGAKGGDIIALHRLITGMGFLDAVRDLGGRFI